MEFAAFSIDLKSGAILAANPASRELLGLTPRDALVGEPATRVLPGAGLQPGSAGSGWLRLGNSPRRYLSWMVGAHPDQVDTTLLVVHPAEHSVLDAWVYRSLDAMRQALEQGPDEALRGFAAALHAGLQLRLVRLLALESGGLLECASIGDEATSSAARTEALEAQAGAFASGPALRALREGVPAHAPVAAAPSREWKAAMQGCDVAGVLAWPLACGGRRFVLELFAQGVDDLGEASTAALVQCWLAGAQDLLRTHGALGQKHLAADALLGAATPAFITNTEGVIVWLNRAFVETYGHTEQEALGATPRLLKSGVHGPRYYRALWTALRSGRAWSGETVDRGADGREVVVQQTVSPVRHDGRVTHFLSIHADITDEARMRRLAERERGIDEISALLTGAAFEERARQLLAAATENGTTVAYVLCAVTTRSGAAPRLETEALAHVRGWLGQCVREATGASMIAASLAPFDFAVLLHQAPELAEEVARAIANAVCEPLPLLGESLELRCRSAVVRFPADGKNIDELRLAADRKLAAQEPNPDMRPAAAPSACSGRNP